MEENIKKILESTEQGAFEKHLVSIGQSLEKIDCHEFFASLIQKGLDQEMVTNSLGMVKIDPLAFFLSERLLIVSGVASEISEWSFNNILNTILYFYNKNDDYNIIFLIERLSILEIPERIKSEEVFGIEFFICANFTLSFPLGIPKGNEAIDYIYTSYETIKELSEISIDFLPYLATYIHNIDDLKSFCKGLFEDYDDMGLRRNQINASFYQLVENYGVQASEEILEGNLYGINEERKIIENFDFELFGKAMSKLDIYEEGDSLFPPGFDNYKTAILAFTKVADLHRDYGGPHYPSSYLKLGITSESEINEIDAGNVVKVKKYLERVKNSLWKNLGLQEKVFDDLKIDLGENKKEKIDFLAEYFSISEDSPKAFLILEDFEEFKRYVEMENKPTLEQLIFAFKNCDDEKRLDLSLKVLTEPKWLLEAPSLSSQYVIFEKFQKAKQAYEKEVGKELQEIGLLSDIKVFIQYAENQYFPDMPSFMVLSKYDVTQFFPISLNAHNETIQSLKEIEDYFGKYLKRLPSFDYGEHPSRIKEIIKILKEKGISPKYYSEVLILKRSLKDRSLDLMKLIDKEEARSGGMLEFLNIYSELEKNGYSSGLNEARVHQYFELSIFGNSFSKIPFSAARFLAPHVSGEKLSEIISSKGVFYFRRGFLWRRFDTTALLEIVSRDSEFSSIKRSIKDLKESIDKLINTLKWKED